METIFNVPHPQSYGKTVFNLENWHTKQLATLKWKSPGFFLVSVVGIAKYVLVGMSSVTLA